MADVKREELQQLLDMGFPLPTVQQALSMTGSLQEATELLMSGVLQDGVGSEAASPQRATEGGDPPVES